jgi:hypothetical protein
MAQSFVNSEDSGIAEKTFKMMMWEAREQPQNNQKRICRLLFKGWASSDKAWKMSIFI